MSLIIARQKRRAGITNAPVMRNPFIADGCLNVKKQRKRIAASI
jgi:hypothetical protein